MNNEEPKKQKRARGRLAQMNKRTRLTRRHYGQWRTPGPMVRQVGSNFTIPHWTFGSV